jgi:hypothetical protein
MNHVRTHRGYGLSMIALFLAILIASITSITLAQTGGAKARTVSIAKSGRVPASRSHTGIDSPAGDPLFLPAVLYDTGGGDANAVAIADLNGDGKLDVVVANGCTAAWYGCISGQGVVGVMLGNGDGTFQTATTYAPSIFEDTYASPITIAVGDVNGDHRPDIIAGNQSSIYGFTVLLGNGDGTFQPGVGIEHGFGSYPMAMAVADVNGDGVLDVMTGEQCFSNDDCSHGAIRVWLGKGDGNFQPAVSYPVVCGGIIGIAVADVNGDQRPDVVASVCVEGTCTDGGKGGAAVLLGVGDGAFKPPVMYETGGNAGWSITVSDVNRDGKPDLVLGNGDNAAKTGGVVGVLLGNGDGTFQAGMAFDSGTNTTRAVGAEDINGDGAPDLFAVPFYSYSGPAVLLLGNGDGTFEAFETYRLPSPMDRDTAIAVSDVNGDGRPDWLITAHAVYGEGRLAVLVNNTGPHSPSTTAVVSDVNPIAPKQRVTYSAAVSGQTGEGVGGTIAFQDGGSTFAVVPVVNNQASYSTTYKWGEGVRAHAITAVYSGDLHNAGSTSAALMEYVGSYPFGSRTVVATSGSPSGLGQAVTFTASVMAAKAKFGPIPDGGLVWFYDGTTVLVSVPLAGGRAEYTTSALSAKTHTIRAKYAGDEAFLPSSGSVKQVVVQ